jgi:hypothetical protein
MTLKSTGATRRFTESCSRREAQTFPSLLLLVRAMGNRLKAGSRSAAPCRLTTAMSPSIQVQAAQCATNPVTYLQTRYARGFNLLPPVLPSPIRPQRPHLLGLVISTRKAAVATMVSFAGGNEGFWRLSLGALNHTRQRKAETSANRRRAVPWSMSIVPVSRWAMSSAPSLCSFVRSRSIASIWRGLEVRIAE